RRRVGRGSFRDSGPARALCHLVSSAVAAIWSGGLARGYGPSRLRHRSGVRAIPAVTAGRLTGQWPKCVALTTPAWPKGSAANGIVTYTAALESAFRECGVRPAIVSWHV